MKGSLSYSSAWLTIGEAADRLKNEGSICRHANWSNMQENLFVSISRLREYDGIVFTEYATIWKRFSKCKDLNMDRFRICVDGESIHWKRKHLLGFHKQQQIM